MIDFAIAIEMCATSMKTFENIYQYRTLYLSGKCVYNTMWTDVKLKLRYELYMS